MVSLAKRIEEVFLPGRPDPLRLAHDTPELQLLQRVRDEAHRFAIEFHRGKRDKAMTNSVLDELAGHRPGPQAEDPPALRLAGALPEGEPRGGRGGAWAAREGRPRHIRAGEQSPMSFRRRRSSTKAPKHRIEDFVVITGFSGAGKSQAMATFEDAGYFCVDNLPPEMIGSLAELFNHRGSKVERAAVASDVRGGDFFDGLVKVLEDLDKNEVPYRLLYLEADEHTLINRFKETRRRHPLAEGGAVEAALREERRLLAPLKERADVSIDTSDLSAARLRKVVADKMLPHGRRGKLAVTFMTFGFKHGSPRDADLTFDVRFLPNPHYEAELREQTGLDRDVIAYVEGSDGIDEFYERLTPLLDYLLPAYEQEGKSHLTVGIGCTGGRHRSVVIAEHLAREYEARGDFLVDVVHRDVDKPPRRP